DSVFINHTASWAFQLILSNAPVINQTDVVIRNCTVMGGAAPSGGFSVNLGFTSNLQHSVGVHVLVAGCRLENLMKVAIDFLGGDCGSVDQLMDVTYTLQDTLILNSQD